MPAAGNIRGHLDDELQWIVQEVKDGVLARDVPKITRGELCRAVGMAVGAVLKERLGDKAADYTVEEFGDVAVDSIRGMGDEIFSQGSGVVAEYAAEACVTYSEGLQMGLRSHYRKVERPAGWDYNPFGQEGGFCNPLKLQYGG